MTKKIASVTGARRGIGLAIAKALAKQGYRVVMSAASPPEAACDILTQMAQKGLDVCYIQCDVSDSQQRNGLISEILARFGRLDLHVNNAGVAPKSRLDILQTTEESFDYVLSVNLRGTFFLCQEVANAMLRLQQVGLEDYHPRIVNISSMSAYTASVNRGEYCISKAGISMVTQLFADRLAEYGIPVFEVRPGIIQTDMTAGVREKYEKLIQEGVTPIRRFGQPEDVANCVLAAASGLLDFSTGQILNADGGFQIRRL